MFITNTCESNCPKQVKCFNVAFIIRAFSNTILQWKIHTLNVWNNEHPLYILKGYAGTGKTTLISIYIKELKVSKRKCVLMAPTGRAAKVLSHYTGYKAHTIHRIIYSIQTNSSNETKIYLNSNKAENTVFVVDEASMIGDNATGTDSFSSRNLLDDLVKYVFSGSNNRLIFIGDTAQLPPVGLHLSPALNLTYLKSLYPLTAYSYEMTEVMRQALDSGILYSATGLRQKLQEQNTTPPILLKSGFKNDVSQVEDAMEMQELFQEYFYGDMESLKDLIKEFIEEKDGTYRIKKEEDFSDDSFIKALRSIYE